MNYFCTPITLYNNPLKVCFSNKKYHITIQTRPPTQIVKLNYLLKNQFLMDF